MGRRWSDSWRRRSARRRLGARRRPEGAILHTTLKIGDAALELSDAEGPYQPMPSTFFLYVPNVDAAYRQALAAGATSIDGKTAVRDPAGNDWFLSTFSGEKPA